MENWQDTYSVIIKQEVHWGDMDAFQHVNNKIYFRYFEDVRIAYLKAIGSLEYMQSSDKGPVLASTTCNYRAPVFHPDTVTIATRARDLQAKRLTMDYVVFSEQQQQIVADGEGMIVYYDFATQRSTEIPEPIATAIRSLQVE